MAVLQAWPGRGFWQGISHGQPGTLAGMTRIDGPDPAAGFPVRLGQRLHHLRRGARIRGERFRRGRARRDRRRVPVRPAAADPPGPDRVHRAVPGGLGADRGPRLPRRPGHRSQQHDPLRAAGHRRVPRRGPRPRRGRRAAASPAAAASWPDRLRIAATPRTLASASISSVAAAGAIGVIILGAAPMAAAQASPVADTILAQAIDGSSAPLDSPRPAVQPHRPARPGVSRWAACAARWCC